MTPAVALAEEDVVAASTAFAEAQRAQLRGDYSRAAELFEVADQAAPSPAALRSAVRNRDAAGQEVRAATLALRALERYSGDRETRELAEAVIARLSPKLAKVRVICDEPCRLSADGGLVANDAVSTREFFVTPGTHTVEGRWPGRDVVVREVRGVAGDTQSLSLTAPAQRAEAAPGAAPLSGPQGQPAASFNADAAVDSDQVGTSHGLSPVVFWIGAGLTVVAGGVLTWSALDTLRARDDYEQAPTQQGYDDGVKLETRTNILAGVTGGLGVATAVIGLFATDWQGRASAQVTQHGVAFSFGGPLP